MANLAHTFDALITGLQVLKPHAHSLVFDEYAGCIVGLRADAVLSDAEIATLRGAGWSYSDRHAWMFD
jgi:hypothetical protein